jgi:hypothetical protein
VASQVKLLGSKLQCAKPRLKLLTELLGNILTDRRQRFLVLG